MILDPSLFSLSVFRPPFRRIAHLSLYMSPCCLSCHRKAVVLLSFPRQSLARGSHAAKESGETTTQHEHTFGRDRPDLHARCRRGANTVWPNPPATGSRALVHSFTSTDSRRLCRQIWQIGGTSPGSGVALEPALADPKSRSHAVRRNRLSPGDCRRPGDRRSAGGSPPLLRIAGAHGDQRRLREVPPRRP